MPSRAGAFSRKLLYRLTGRVRLLDPVRDHAYAWALPQLGSLKRGAAILDVGSRNSSFPSFLAWRGLQVTVVERDGRFGGLQLSIASAWGVKLDVRVTDLLSLRGEPAFDAVCAIFSLQHAGDTDAACYRKAASLLKTGGILLTVNQCAAGATRWQRGRDDGDMRIYGEADLQDRIRQPLLEAGLQLSDERYATADFEGRRITTAGAGDAERNVCLMAFSRR